MRLVRRLGVPQEVASCHIAEIDGYVVEDHVPAAEVKRLLVERPARRASLWLGCRWARQAWRWRAWPRPKR
jgi:hypothetical protein